MADLFSILGQAGAFKAIPQAADRSIAINPKAQAAAAAPPKQDFWGNLGKSVAAIPGAVGGAIAHAATDGFSGLIHGAQTNLGIQHQQNNLDSRNQQLQSKQDALIKAYHSQQIDKGTYQKGLKDLLGHGTQLSADASKVANAQRYGYGQAAVDAAKAGGTVATLLSPLADAGLVAEGAVGARAALGAAAKAVPGVQKANDIVAGGLAAGKAVGPANGLPGAAAAVAGKLVRNALVTQPVVGIPGQVASDVKNKNYGDLALQAGTLAVPGAMGLAGRALGELAPAAKTALFGREGFWNSVKSNGGADMLAHIDSLSGKAQADAIKTSRILQQYNVDQVGGNTSHAGHYWVEALKKDGIDPATAKPAELLAHAQKWIKGQTIIGNAAKEGRVIDTTTGKPVVLKDGESLIPARANAGEINAIRQAWAGTTSPEQRVAALTTMMKGGAKFGDNSRLSAKLHDIAQKDDWATHLNPTKLPALGGQPLQIRMRGAAGEAGRTVTLPQGYQVAKAKNIRATVKNVKDTAPLDRGVAPNKLLAPVGKAIVKAGLSPEAVNPELVSSTLKGKFAARLANVDPNLDSKAVLSALQKFEKPGATNPTMLTRNDVSGALQKVAPNAKPAEVLKAVRGAYADLPASQVGAGGKVLNAAIDKTHGLLGSYLRTEQHYRYEQPLTSLPFRVKQIIKSGLVATAKGANPLVGHTNEDLQTMKRLGFLNAGGSKVGSDIGLGDAVGTASGGTGEKLIHGELQHVITNLGASVAKNNNTTLKEIFSRPLDDPLRKQLTQSLRLTTGYGEGGYLNSPLAKTLNLAIYPSRFETKVATVAAKAFAHASPATQIAVTSGLINTNKFLGSPEGKQWQKDNSEFIGLLKAFTPLQSIDNVMKFFTAGHHVGDLGEVGGLPVGIITTMLEHQGVNLGKLGTSQYLDPKTGQPVPDKIPNTMKARFQQAGTDLVGSLYSYPGKTAGLTSKTKLTQSALPILKPNAKEVTPTLKDGTTAPKASAPASTNRIPAIVRGSTPVIKPVATRAIYSGRASRPKIYAKRRGQGGF